MNSRSLLYPYSDAISIQFHSIPFNSIWNICKIYSIFSGNVPTIHFVTRFILWILVHEIHNKLLFIAHTCVINTAHYTSSSCVENRPFFLCQSSISNINGIYIVCISLCMKTSIWHLQTHLRYTGPLHTHTHTHCRNDKLYCYLQTNDDELSVTLSILPVCMYTRTRWKKLNALLKSPKLSAKMVRKI